MNTIDIELDAEMEMPCPCEKCGKWFDLQDGYGSELWYKNIVICESCYHQEESEIELKEEIENLQAEVDESQDQIKWLSEQLPEQKQKLTELTNRLQQLRVDHDSEHLVNED